MRSPTALAVIDADPGRRGRGPEHAELAELSLLLAGERPDAERRRSLPRSTRGSPTASLAEPAPRCEPGRQPARLALAARSRARPWAGRVVAPIVVLGSGSRARPASDSARPVSTTRRPSRSAPGASAAGTSTSSASAASSSSASPSVATHSAGVGQLPAAGAPSGRPRAPAEHSRPPDPSTSGRQIVQSAQLSLSTRPAASTTSPSRCSTWSPPSTASSRTPT